MAAISFKRSSLENFNKYNSLLVGNEAFSPSDFDLLETQVLSSSASSVTFTGLGSYSDYKHLQLRVIASHNSASPSSFRVQFNSDTGNNYARHALAGQASVVSSSASTGQDEMAGGSLASNTANTFAPTILDILDFSDTSKNTTIKALSGTQDGTPIVILRSGLYINTNAVTSIEIDSFSGVNLLTGSRFSLYGTKAA